jgi:hypothetical protein
VFPAEDGTIGYEMCDTFAEARQPTGKIRRWVTKVGKEPEYLAELFQDQKRYRRRRKIVTSNTVLPTADAEEPTLSNVCASYYL